MLKIFNSLTGKKQEFKPIEPGKVGLYVCGMTVYDFCHIGHARVMVVFDMVVRYLRSLGLNVNYVRNITDIDDKIIQRANEHNNIISELTAHFIKEMNEDAHALGVQSPSVEPRATEHIADIISVIAQLIAKNYAYVADNGDVFYDVSAFSSYGKLSGKKIDELRAGERVQVQEAKDDPLDFALWKGAKPNEPRWDSPWGPGRPGWHIECSAMSMHHLGTHFDIHGGGQDLQFPHHENEIAQSEAATGKPFVNFWMHNGFVRIDEEKMSKSLGNFFTVREVLQEYQPEIIRFFILSSHYRSPLNYSVDNLQEAKSALSGLYRALRCVASSNNIAPLKNYVDEFNTYMDDDFNTPKAISLLHELAHQLNRNVDKTSNEIIELAGTLKYLGAFLGLLQASPQTFIQEKIGSASDVLDNDTIQKFIAERNNAKRIKDYEKADRIRDHLIAKGIKLEDTGKETLWYRN